MATCANSLGAGAATFQLILRSELPPAWQVEVSEGARAHAARQLQAARVTPEVALELPDVGWAWRYQRWANEQGDSASLPIIVVAWDEFRGETSKEKRKEAAALCFRSLWETGKPAPLSARIFNPH